MIYSCSKTYLESAASVKEKVAKLDLIISAMYDAAERAAVSGEIEEYLIDDGQSKIKNVYRDVGSIVNAIVGYEKLRQMYYNRLIGRKVSLRDKNSNCIR